MAFVARRNTEGQLVDCQVISGRGTSTMAMSDLSDEDTDSGTVQGYSNRSYVSPTVRYVTSKDDDDVLDSCFTFDGIRGRNSANNVENDLESVVSFEGHFDDSVKANPAEAESDTGTLSDYRLDLASDDEMVKCGPSPTADAAAPQEDNCKADDLDSLDGETICSPSAFGQERLDVLSLGSLESLGLQPEDDVQSLSSIESSTLDRATVCPPVAQEDSFSLGSLDSNSVYRLMESRNSPDNDNTDNQSQVTSRTFNMKSSPVRRSDCSSVSSCSWTDMYGGALKQSESRSNIIPSLSLSLSAASSSGSSTYFRNLDEDKERHGQEAYQEWVKRKERQKQEKQQAAKQERERRDAETALRQRLAKERYQEWVRQKELQQKKAATGSIKSAASYGSYSSTSSFASLASGSGGNNRAQRKETPEAAKKRLAEWDRVKTQQQQRDRERERQKQQSKEQLEKQRKQKSEGAWQNWMKSVSKRPKPVPLNQGFDTLRGTISNIYMNPVQWVSNIDPNDSRGN
ncbi:uncharacterized protein LOC6576762 [Drosophila mojavensis]|uniref:Coiled-coil domain-containing protein n=1 Tax=Drosophila mojavensis TaxID=7230 RepID=B4KGJ4_DROMO|nr:uncharacterized protein LOC6576762 [Drosophila mojavensis]EDW12190.1 uncharacterized protein Dmoj_GI17555 [Drosophila mojavensis]